MARFFRRSGLQSLCENSKSRHFCSARLQAGTLESTRCPPEGGRYMIQNPVLTQTLKPAIKCNPNGRVETRPSKFEFIWHC